MSDRFEKEYLRADREDIENTSSLKEEAVWIDLEDKLDPVTIDCRGQVNAEMRWWFRETYRYMGDDCSILKRWNEREDLK